MLVLVLLFGFVGYVVHIDDQLTVFIIFRLFLRRTLWLHLWRQQFLVLFGLSSILYSIQIYLTVTVIVTFFLAFSITRLVGFRGVLVNFLFFLVITATDLFFDKSFALSNLVLVKSHVAFAIILL